MISGVYYRSEPDLKREQKENAKKGISPKGGTGCLMSDKKKSLNRKKRK